MVMSEIKNNLHQMVINHMRTRIANLSFEKRRKRAARLISNNYPLVLMYHSVVPRYIGEDYSVSTATVEQNIVDLLNDGYSFVFEDEFYLCQPQSVILTFDDGLANNYTEVFPLLKKYNVKASINVIVDKISDPDREYLTEEQILEMKASGLVQFQSHTCSHRSLDQLTPEEVCFELKESKKRLQSLLHEDISVFVYPREDFTEEIAFMASKYYNVCYGWAGVMEIDQCYNLPRIEIFEGDSDYAFHILFEHKLDLYHKLTWFLGKKKSKNVYKRVLFK